MKTATITIQIGSSDAPFSPEDAQELLDRIVDIVNDEAYVAAAYVNP